MATHVCLMSWNIFVWGKLPSFVCWLLCRHCPNVGCRIWKMSAWIWSRWSVRQTGEILTQHRELLRQSTPPAVTRPTSDRSRSLTPARLICRREKRIVWVVEAESLALRSRLEWQINSLPKNLEDEIPFFKRIIRDYIPWKKYKTVSWKHSNSLTRFWKPLWFLWVRGPIEGLSKLPRGP